MSLYKALKDKIKYDAYPFHMPGHKRNKAFLPVDAVGFDFTEVSGLDCLHAPDGVIKQTQEAIACLTGADYSFMLVNGGSSGMTAALMAVLGEEDTVVIMTNCHKSVHNALVITGARPVYVSPDILDNGMLGGADPDLVEKAIEDHGAKAVVLTSPTYEGFTSDVRAIAGIAHKLGAVLIVDECHGAHFPFSSAFPETAISCGADISVNSWHKTLPCFNQAAVLNLKGGRVDTDRLKRSVSCMNTTSPSYPIMASMDLVCTELYKSDAFDIYVNELKKLRQRLNELQNIHLVGDEVIGKAHIKDVDISKLTFSVYADKSGFEIGEMLYEGGIELELCAQNRLIAMTSVADTFDAYDMLFNELKVTDRRLVKKEKAFSFDAEKISTAEITPRAAFYKESELVDIDGARGRIAAEDVSVFPPDIPFIFAGQKITSNQIEAIKRFMSGNERLAGLYDDKIRVIK